MCNFKTEQKFHHLVEDGVLAFELTLHVHSGPLITLRAMQTDAGLTWAYEVGTGAGLDTADCATASSAARSVVTP